MGDLRELLRRAAAKPTAPPPLRHIERRAKRRTWRGRLSIVAIAIVIPLGLLLVPGLSDLVGSEDPAGVDRRPEPSEGSDIVIASGRFDPAIRGPLGGKTWELVVWDQSDERFCWRVSVDGEEQGTTCGPRDRATHGDDVFRGWGYNKLGGAGGATQSLAMGELRGDVESVEFRFRDGKILPAQVIRPPSDLEIPARFFVAALPDLRPGHVAALDRAGDVLATQEMRVKRTRLPSNPSIRAEVVSTITIGDQPIALDADDEQVWVTGDHRIFRVDTTTESVSSYDAEMTGIDVALDEDSVWMSGGGDGALPQGYVQAFDRETGDLRRTLKVPGSPYGLALDDGLVWIADAQGLMWRAPQNGSGQLSSKTIAGQPRYLDAAGGEVWVAASSPGGMWHIRRGGSEGAPDELQLPRPNSGTRCPYGVAVDQATIWVTDYCQGTVLSLDEEGKVTEEIPVGGKTSGIVVVDGAPWVAVSGTNEVVRIDPRSEELLRIEVGRGPIDVAYGAGAIWVTNSEDGTLSRIELGG